VPGVGVIQDGLDGGACFFVFELTSA